MLKLMRPTHFTPIHGEYRMLRIHAALAHEVGIDKDKTFIRESKKFCSKLENKSFLETLECVSL